MFPSLTDSFIAISEFMTSTAGSVLWCGGTVLLFAVSLYKFRTQVNPRLAALNEAVSFIQSQPPVASFATAYRDFASWAETHDTLGHAWNEFSETLILPDPSDEQQYICNTHESHCCFTESIVFDESINITFYKALPNYLTGLGILGTFVGLVCGIYLASAGLASGDANELKEALRKLLDGASLAFLTSIFGLFTSMIFSWCEKKKLHEANLALAQWNTELDKRIQRLTPEELAAKQLKQLTKQTEHLEVFVNQVAFNIADALNDRMTNTLVPVLEKLTDSVDAMRANQSERNDDLLREIVDTFKTTMTGAAGKEMEAMSSTLATLQTTLVPLIQNMQSAQTEMQQAASNITSQMGAFYEKSNREFSSGITQITETIGDSVQDARRLLHDDLSAAFGQTAARMQEAAGAITERIGASYAECSQALTANVSEATSQIGNTVREAGQLLNGELTTAFTQAAARMTDAVSAIEATVDKVRQSGQASGDAATKTGAMLTQLSGFIEKLGEHQTSVSQAAFAIRQSATNVSSASDAMSQAASSTENASAAIRAATEQISTTQQTIEGVWKNYEQRFVGVDASLEKLIHSLTDSHKSFCDSTTEYTGQLDKSAAEITNKLSASIQEFEGAIADLAEAFNKVRR